MIGIDFGGSKIEGVALDQDGSEHNRVRVPTPVGDYRASLRAIADLVERIANAVGIDAPVRPGVGIGIPGTISPDTGRVKNANSTWLNGADLCRDLELQLGTTVRIENDANCFARSEAYDGAGAGAQTVFAVILGTGVGGGISIGGQTLIGVNAISGEWGHNPLPWPQDAEWPGPDCYCGKTGCIETLLCGGALARDAGRTDGDAGAVVDAAERGDTRAESAIERYEDRLARALAGVVNVIDPDCIVLGGGVSNIDRLYRTVPAMMRGFVFSDQLNTTLRKAVHGDASGVRGAARLWL